MGKWKVLHRSIEKDTEMCLKKECFSSSLLQENKLRIKKTLSIVICLTSEEWTS